MLGCMLSSWRRLGSRRPAYLKTCSFVEAERDVGVDGNAGDRGRCAWETLSEGEDACEGEIRGITDDDGLCGCMQLDWNERDGGEKQ
jgi:hypothetical protein